MNAYKFKDVKKRYDFLDRQWLLKKDQRHRINILISDLKKRYCGHVEFKKVSLGNVNKEILTSGGKYNLD